jgi:hypothetical protein
LSVIQGDDADGHNFRLGHLRGTIPPRPGNNFEAILGERPYQQWRQNALGADTYGEFFESRIFKDAAGVGL